MVSTSTELFNCFFHYYYVLDPELLIAGMIPSSKAQQDAVFWLSDYFNTFGDSYSNSALTHISVGTRAELYRDYCQDQARHDLEIVNEQKFLLLWRTLFPYVVLRDFVGIFGKCDTCHHIDRLRRETTNREILEALQKCHLMHRSGLFMPERLR